MNFDNDEEVLGLMNRLLERLHQADGNNKCSIVLNIYEKGSLHVDHVDNQYFYGDKWAKTLQDKEVANSQASAEPAFGKDTPLSALFRENFHDELRKVIESWRPFLIDDDPGINALAISHFKFDFTKILAMGVYIDLGRLLGMHPLKNDNMRTLADYLFLHSNLSSSQPTLYAQLRKYMKK